MQTSSGCSEERPGWPARGSSCSKTTQQRKNLRLQCLLIRGARQTPRLSRPPRSEARARWCTHSSCGDTSGTSNRKEPHSNWRGSSRSRGCWRSTGDRSSSGHCAGSRMTAPQRTPFPALHPGALVPGPHRRSRLTSCSSLRLRRPCGWHSAQLRRYSPQRPPGGTG